MTATTNQEDSRRLALSARRNLTSIERVQQSHRIAHRFLNSRFFYRSQNIAVYLSSHDEVDTSEIILRTWRANKRVFAPVIVSKTEILFHQVLPDSVLVRNRFGLLEPQRAKPIDARQLDVVITPLAAFDESYNRIGMGGGFYDRHFSFLANRMEWLQTKMIGVAFACQRVEKIKPNHWDIPLYQVISSDK